jgi:uncharacterized membrane protein YcaP (DUF421 family)
MELERLLFRTLFAWLVLHQLFRYAGKRTVTSVGSAGNRSGIDLMLALVVGDLIDDLLWAEVPAAQFVAILRHRSASVASAVEGVPVQVVAHGEPAPGGMRRERISRKALTALLRLHGIGPERWGEVRAAYVETEGPLSVLRESWARPATKADRARVTRGET